MTSGGSNEGASFDSIFTATNNGQAVKPKPKPLSTQSYTSNIPSYGVADDTLKGRNLGAESISSDRKKTYFQRYVFDSYKYQSYFNASTRDIIEKTYDAIGHSIRILNQKHL